MKKLLLSLTLLLSITAGSFAQSLTTPNLNLTINGSINDFVLPAYATITNITGSAVPVMVQRTNLSLAGAHTTSFCWGVQCYPTTVDVSTVPAVIAAGSDENSFIGDLNINSSTGTSVVNFLFYNQNNPADSTSITVTYNVTATGISENNPTNAIGNPSPNPADRYTTLTYGLKSNSEKCKVEMINMLGTKVAEYNFSNRFGLMIIPTENLPSGIYFCAFKENNKTIMSKKLVVSHK